MSKDVTILKNDIFVESVPITKDSRHWKNEVSFAEFVKNLLPDVGQIAILNDISGQVNSVLSETNNLQFTIFTPNTSLTRMVAQTYPDRKNSWLKPNRFLQEDKGYTLGQSSTYAVVIKYSSSMGIFNIQWILNTTLPTYSRLSHNRWHSILYRTPEGRTQ